MRTSEESNAQTRAAQSRGETIAGVSALFCMVWFLGGFIVLGYQIVQWLKTAIWVELPMYVVFDWLEIELSFISDMKWQGIKAILIWLLEWPLSATLFVFGGLISWALIDFSEAN